MKTRWLIFALSVSLVWAMQAQVVPNLATNIVGFETSSSASNALHESIVETMTKAPPPFDPVAVAMGAQETNQSSQATIQAAELAATAAAQLRVPLNEEIELLPDGAIGRFGPHHVVFGGDSKTPVDLRTPDGQRLRSTLFGLAYFSPDRKHSLLIAELKSTEGELLSGNRVLYRNAFAGDGVEGDLLYTYTSHSLEQDVVIRKKIAPPEAYNLPPDSRLAVMTEFLECPMPRRLSGVVDLTEHNQRLGVVGEATMQDDTLFFWNHAYHSRQSIRLGTGWTGRAGREKLGEI